MNRKKTQKKAAPKKVTTKKTVKKAAPKKVTKKTAAPKKKVAPKKTAAPKKKVAPKKATPKKTAAPKKKATPKKTVAPKKGKKAAQKVARRNKKAITNKKVVTTVTTVTTTTTNVVPTETHYILVLDESGSMQSVRETTLSGLNEQLQTIQKLDRDFPDQEYFVSIVKFNTGVNVLMDNVPAKNVKQLTLADYYPDGGTALYDAIGHSIHNLNKRIQTKTASGEASALVVILTDGEENSSKEYKSSQIKDLITEFEKTAMWTFTFIGANQDAILAADRMGISRGNTANYSSSAKGTSLAFASMDSALYKRAAYTSAGINTQAVGNASRAEGFMSSVVGTSANIGEDKSLLDLSGTITSDDIKKAKEILKNGNSQTSIASAGGTSNTNSGN